MEKNRKKVTDELFKGADLGVKTEFWNVKVCGEKYIMEKILDTKKMEKKLTMINRRKVVVLPVWERDR